MTKQEFIEACATIAINGENWSVFYDRLFPDTTPALKPFDLEAALRGDKVINAQGKKVTEMVLLKTSTSGFPLVSVVDGVSGNYKTNGQYGVNPSLNDLFMAPREVTGWVNVYRRLTSGDYKAHSHIYDTEDDSRFAISAKLDEMHIATVQITFFI